MQQFEDGEYTINEDVLAQSVSADLKIEEEGGITLIHRMLDRSVERIVENGEYGIEFKDE